MAYWLAKQSPEALFCRVGGPNAGHTAIDETGRTWRLQQIPVGALMRDSDLAIGAGSVVDLAILEREIHELDEAGYDVSSRLVIDPMATVLEAKHAEQETQGRPHGESGITHTIGSTGKGVGAARADRIWRTARTVRDYCDPDRPHILMVGPNRIIVEDVAWHLGSALELSQDVQLEGTQGFGLGLHGPAYPFVTSQDCRAIDVMAQAGISPWAPSVEEIEIWVVFRTFPIRVAGNSGPLHEEIAWDDIGVPAEKTTVTKKERRVGRWDPALAKAAIEANGGPNPDWGYKPVRLALLFLDYLYPELHGCTDPERILFVARAYLISRERELGQPISAVGVGPGQIVRIDEEN